MSNNTPLGDSELQTLALEGNAAAVNYHNWLCSMAQPYLGRDPLELGSGLGDYAQTWLDQGLPRITLSEIEPTRRAHLECRFGDEERVRFAQIDLEAQTEGRYSCVVSFNVMEHVPDDLAAFRAAFALLGPGGYFLTFAPAFPFAMSKFDREIGHVRRYTLDSIKAGYRDAGFEIVEARYCNAPGLVAWFVGMRLLGMRPTGGRTVSAWDRLVVPRARRWEERRRVPFGQSLLCVGRKGAAPAVQPVSDT
jgi:SAM-dependent methyltransferase